MPIRLSPDTVRSFLRIERGEQLALVYCCVWTAVDLLFWLAGYVADTGAPRSLAAALSYPFVLVDQTLKRVVGAMLASFLWSIPHLYALNLLARRRAPTDERITSYSRLVAIGLWAASCAYQFPWDVAFVFRVPETWPIALRFIVAGHFVGVAWVRGVPHGIRALHALSQGRSSRTSPAD